MLVPSFMVPSPKIASLDWKSVNPNCLVLLSLSSSVHSPTMSDGEEGAAFCVAAAGVALLVPVMPFVLATPVELAEFVTLVF